MYITQVGLFVCRFAVDDGHTDEQAVSSLIPGGDGEITHERSGETYGVADTCQSATVPSYFRPYNNTAESPFDWALTGAFMSYGYR